jgi:hypothetical protein
MRAWAGGSTLIRVCYEPGESAINDETGEHKRIFTLAEAQALIPTLQQLFQEFGEAREAATEAATMLEDLEARRSRANTLEMARPLREHRERLGEHAERMRTVVRRVLDMGIEIRRLDPALLDFAWRRHGQLVYLCWEEDEPSIAYWHPVDTGFTGRQPLEL